MITVIVPIHNAVRETAACLNALREHAEDAVVVLIDDASTDDGIKTLLDRVPAHWQVLKNLVNQGFVKTVNRGLALDSGHSILLNSDAVVSAGWLQGFKQAIAEIHDLGTATPWSNNAEIVSIPQTLYNNPIPTDLDRVGVLFSELQPTWPELPTGVGFCMLITAQAKAEVGEFDAATFGHGYGEENDYCMRVKAHGMRNVLVDNSYVAHVGNASFAAMNMRPNEQTMQRLLAKHPSYSALIQKFIQNDPLSHLRESIVAKIGGF